MTKLRKCNRDSLDWEYAAILPYPTSFCTADCTAVEEKDAFFYMTGANSELAIDYYYELYQ